MVGPYRGGSEEARLRALDAEIAALEVRFTETFWTRVAPLWEVPKALQTDLEPIAARQSRLELLTATLRRARDDAGASKSLPPFPGEPETVSYIPPMVLDLFERVLQPVIKQRVTVLRRPNHWWALKQYGAELVVDHAPVQLEVIRAQTDGGGPVVVEVVIRTSVAPAAELVLGPEGTWEDVRKLLGFSRDILMDDPRFDPDFLIHGDEVTAKAYLTAVPRFELHRACAIATPKIKMSAGLVEARCSVGNAARVLPVLVGWHQLPTPAPLLHDDAQGGPNESTPS